MNVGAFDGIFVGIFVVIVGELVVGDNVIDVGDDVVGEFVINVGFFVGL